MRRASSVERLPRGGGARAAELYERHREQIFRHCLYRLGSREEAEDATQTTFLNAFRSLESGVRPVLEIPWLFTIANHVILNRVRAARRRGRVERPTDLDGVLEAVPCPEGPVDELIGLTDALATLPEQQRRVLLLREVQGLAYSEIADELGISQSAVETLLFRSRRALAEQLTTRWRPGGRQVEDQEHRRNSLQERGRTGLFVPLP